MGGRMPSSTFCLDTEPYVCCERNDPDWGTDGPWIEVQDPDLVPTFHGCEAERGPMSTSHDQSLEALSYVPVRYDDSTTIDTERSQDRYSKTVLNSTRARTQHRTSAWEDWLRIATAGRQVMLLGGITDPSPSCRGFEPCTKSLATFYIDMMLTKLTIIPEGESDFTEMIIPLDRIQVICPVTDFMLLVDQVESKLDEEEKACAVLVQFNVENDIDNDNRSRVCFLEESEESKDHFVQALTALWLEKRNDHSMWF